MAIREAAVERYTFRCHHCDREWSRDYDVAQVILAGGDTRDYYYYNGLPAAAPGAPRSVSCPACGAEHAEVSFHSHPAPAASTPSSSPAPVTRGAVDPTESSREMAHTIEILLAAAKEPGSGGFSQVDDVKEVVRALQSEVARLPQLLHELANVLDQVQTRPNPRHAGDIPAAIRCLHRSADTASELTESLADDLSHARTALAGLESFTIGPGPKSQGH